jgi:hypothetical protein
MLECTYTHPHPLSITHPHTPTLNHTPTHTHSQSHTHTHPLSITHPHTHTHTHTHSLSRRACMHSLPMHTPAYSLLMYTSVHLFLRSPTAELHSSAGDLPACQSCVLGRCGILLAENGFQYRTQVVSPSLTGVRGYCVRVCSRLQGERRLASC